MKKSDSTSLAGLPCQSTPRLKNLGPALNLDLYQIEVPSADNSCVNDSVLNFQDHRLEVPANDWKDEFLGNQVLVEGLQNVCVPTVAIASIGDIQRSAWIALALFLAEFHTVSSICRNFAHVEIHLNYA